MSADEPLLLCCLLWAKPGLETEMTAYEDRVLALLATHGGEVLERLRGSGQHGTPHEVQSYRFPSQAALDAYLVDPERVALAGERDRVVVRTELFPVERLASGA
ncbi:hypothetical protein SAMN05428970_2875 [Agromyces sp. CF514]|uniref:hypothetical protein n=1 Tax=Agromyces sp. CF514 TaxID=1881031 RepID=UPI0008E11FD1|nr:hypothetical protein [Agromyces sp. CF514]SFR83837.1 hypothetical protein SAMN05428970_2875 [Agromyces sp. CF514]